MCMSVVSILRWRVELRNLNLDSGPCSFSQIGLGQDSLAQAETVARAYLAIYAQEQDEDSVYSRPPGWRPMRERIYIVDPKGDRHRLFI